MGFIKCLGCGRDIDNFGMDQLCSNCRALRSGSQENTKQSTQNLIDVLEKSQREAEIRAEKARDEAEQRAEVARWEAEQRLKNKDKLQAEGILENVERLYNAGLNQEALQQCLRAIQVYPSATAFNWAGIITTDINQRIYYFEKAHILNEKDECIRINLAQHYLLKAQKYSPEAEIDNLLVKAKKLVLLAGKDGRILKIIKDLARTYVQRAKQNPTNAPSYNKIVEEIMLSLVSTLDIKPAIEELRQFPTEIVGEATWDMARTLLSKIKQSIPPLDTNLLGENAQTIALKITNHIEQDLPKENLVSAINELESRLIISQELQVILTETEKQKIEIEQKKGEKTILESLQINGFLFILSPLLPIINFDWWLSLWKVVWEKLPDKTDYIAFFVWLASISFYLLLFIPNKIPDSVSVLIFVLLFVFSYLTGLVCYYRKTKKYRKETQQATSIRLEALDQAITKQI